MFFPKFLFHKNGMNGHQDVEADMAMSLSQMQLGRQRRVYRLKGRAIRKHQKTMIVATWSSSHLRTKNDLQIVCIWSLIYKMSRASFWPPVVKRASFHSWTIREIYRPTSKGDQLKNPPGAKSVFFAECLEIGSITVSERGRLWLNLDLDWLWIVDNVW